MFLDPTRFHTSGKEEACHPATLAVWRKRTRQDPYNTHVSTHRRRLRTEQETTEGREAPMLARSSLWDAHALGADSAVAHAIR